MHSDLIAKLEKLTGPDPEVDAEICIALQYGGKSSEGATNVRTDPDWDGDLLFEIGNEDCCNPIPELTASLDAAIALVERVLPDTDDRRHSCTIWTGRRPAARIFYRQRCAEDEGGWAIGALNNWDVRGATPAIALLIATLKVLEARDG